MGGLKRQLLVEIEELLATGAGEDKLHRFLLSHPYLLTNLGFGVKRIFSKPRLGGDYVPDFALLGWGNYNVWTFVELERASHRLFTREGLMTRALHAAIKQVSDWWRFLEDYREYATRDFPDLSGDRTAAIVIGRRGSLSGAEVRRLQQLNDCQLGGKLRVVTWDWLLDHVRSLSERQVTTFEAEASSSLLRYRTLGDMVQAEGVAGREPCP
jgi:hypothetical protein